MVVGAAIWGIRLIQGLWKAKPLLDDAAKAAARAGSGSWGKGTYNSASAARNAARTRAPSSAAQARARQTAVDRGKLTRAAGAERETAARAAKEAKDAARRKATKDLAKVRGAERLAKTPWLNRTRDFIKLDKSAIQNLTTSQAKLYREAVKTARGVDKAKTVQKLRSSAEATVNPVGRAARRLGVGLARVSKTGSRAGGAGRAAYRVGEGYLGAGAAIAGAKYLLSDKDKDGEKKDEKKGEKKDEKKKNGKGGNGKGSSTTTTTARPASPDEKIEIAQSRHGKYSKQAGRAWGKKHGIDISYDSPGMSPEDYQEGLDKGTISKKLGTSKEGKLTRSAREDLEQLRMHRHGGSVSSDNYKLRKKSSKAKSGKVSKKSSWNY